MLLKKKKKAGKAEVKVVHHQDLNKRILIALVVASTVLGGLLLFLSCLWIYRQKKLRDSDGKNRKKMGKPSLLSPPIGSYFSYKAGE